MLFVATALYNGQVSHMYMRGALEAQKAFPDIQFSVAVGTYLVINRQTLTERFLQSDGSHLLFVDSDIGWLPSAVKSLLDADVDVVSGVYLQRNGESIIPAEPLGTSDPSHPRLVECFMVPAGFLLLKRAAVERMHKHLHPMPLWSMSYEHGEYIGEDVHFCRQWRKLGGSVWLALDAVVDHIGEVVFKLPPEETPGIRYKGKAA